MSSDPNKVDRFPALLKQSMAEIDRALPKHMTAERMTRIALTCFRMNPALATCDPRSVIAAVMVAAQMGLEPGVGGQCYLIPYKSECTLVPGWQGLVDLVSRAGRASCWTGAVYKGDEFDYALGDKPFIVHKPIGDEDPANLTHVYAVGRVNGSEWPIVEVWPVKKARAHLQRWNKVGGRHYANKHFDMYARKVALLQVIKYLPKSVELRDAITLDTIASRNQPQHITDPFDVIEGTWAPVLEEDPESDDDATAASDDSADDNRHHDSGKSATSALRDSEKPADQAAAGTVQAHNEKNDTTTDGSSRPHRNRRSRGPTE